MAERPLEALLVAGAESVPRDVEVLDPQQLTHTIHALPACLSNPLASLPARNVKAAVITGRASAGGP